MRIRFAFILLVGSASAVTFAQTPAVYKKPQEVIQEANIARLEADVERAKDWYDCEGIVRSASREVGAYNGQFVEGRRIQDERRSAGSTFLDLDKNTARLIALTQKRTPGESAFLGEHPYMLRLHTLMGICYDKSEKPYRAASEFAMAFRYLRLEEPWKVPAKNESKGALYEQMAAGFGDPDRAKQETDPELARDAGQVRELYTRWKDEVIRVREAEKGRYAADADKARGRQDRTLDADARLRDAQTALTSSETSLDALYNGSFKKYNETKRRKAGALAMRMAGIVKTLEIDNKKNTRLLNRSSFYRGMGSELGEERTELRNFVGYGILLELAHKIDADNPEYIKLLADEYRMSRRLTDAIALQEKWIELAGTQASPDDRASAWARLAGMYTDQKNYIRAATAYEESLKSETDAVKQNAMRLELADLYFDHTGNFPGAETLYRKYLEEGYPRDLTTLGIRERTDHRSRRYKILRNLTSIDRRHARTDREKAGLAQAREQFLEIEAEYRKLDAERSRVQTRINEVKRELLAREEDALQKEYYTLLRIDLPQAKSLSDFVRVRMNSLNLPGLLERLALIALRERNFDGAMALYAEIISRGTGEQATRARINRERVSLTLTDGLLRDPVVPPQFER